MEYGNLAYKLEPEVEVEEKKVKKVQKAPKQKLNLKVILFAVLISFAAYYMISKQVAVFEGDKKVESLQKQLDSLESKSIQKSFEIEQCVDLETVEDMAVTKLNMQRPDQNQKVYLNVTGEDSTEITSKKNESIKSKFSKYANNIRKNIDGIFKLGW